MKRTNILARLLGALGVAVLAFGFMTPVMADSGRGRHGDDGRDFRFRFEKRFDNDRFDRDFRFRKEIRFQSDRRFDNRFDKKFDRFNKFHKFDRSVFFHR